MERQRITVNRHVLVWLSGRVDHDGPCSWENCRRFLPGLDRDDIRRMVIDLAIDSLRAEEAQA